MSRPVAVCITADLPVLFAVNGRDAKARLGSGRRGTIALEASSFVSKKALSEYSFAEQLRATNHA